MISWYPVKEVLKTTSPDVLPLAPKEIPSKTVPSAKASLAGMKLAEKKEDKITPQFDNLSMRTKRTYEIQLEFKN